MSNFRMNVVQEERGIVSGTWSAKTGEGDGGCSVSTPCDIGGELIGRNTVAQVEIHFLGSGKFEGALLEQNSLRGIFIVGASYDTISFVRTGQ
jgi:hypothetical protein